MATGDVRLAANEISTALKQNYSKMRHLMISSSEDSLRAGVLQKRNEALQLELESVNAFLEQSKIDKQALEEELEATSQKAAESKKECAQLRKKVNSLETELLKRPPAVVDAEPHPIAKQNLLELLEEKTQLQQQNATLLQRYKKSEQENYSLRIACDEYTAKVELLEKVLTENEDLRRQALSLSSTAKKFQEEKLAACQQLQASEESCNKLSSELGKTKSKSEEFRKENEVLKVVESELKKELSVKLEKEKTLLLENETALSSLEQTQAQHLQAKEQIFKLSLENEKLQSTVLTLRLKLFQRAEFADSSDTATSSYLESKGLDNELLVKYMHQIEQLHAVVLLEQKKARDQEKDYLATITSLNQTIYRLQEAAATEVSSLKHKSEENETETRKRQKSSPASSEEGEATATAAPSSPSFLEEKLRQTEAELKQQSEKLTRTQTLELESKQKKKVETLVDLTVDKEKLEKELELAKRQIVFLSSELNEKKQLIQRIQSEVAQLKEENSKLSERFWQTKAKLKEIADTASTRMHQLKEEIAKKKVEQDSLQATLSSISSRIYDLRDKVE